MSSFIGHLYFSVRGRTSRRLYWQFGVTGFFLLGILLGVVVRMAGSSVAPLVIFGALLPILVWGSIGLHAKRLHDISLSAWWMAAGSVVSLALAYFVSFRAGQFCSFALWLVVGLVPGTPGANRFGADPNRSRMQDVARQRAPVA